MTHKTESVKATNPKEHVGHLSMKVGAHYVPAGKGHAKSVAAMSSPHGNLKVRAKAPHNPLHAKLAWNTRGAVVKKAHAKRYPIPIK